MRVTSTRPRNGRRAVWALLLTCLACVPLARAGTIALESGARLSVTETRFNRGLPHRFHDQALATLTALYPEHQLLASRRFGRVGATVYALVGYREQAASAAVVIDALAVHGRRAWRLQTVVAGARYGDVLLEVIERIGRFASDPPAPPVDGD